MAKRKNKRAPLKVDATITDIDNIDKELELGALTKDKHYLAKNLESRGELPLAREWNSLTPDEKSALSNFGGYGGDVDALDKLILGQSASSDENKDEVIIKPSSASDEIETTPNDKDIKSEESGEGKGESDGITTPTSKDVTDGTATSADKTKVDINDPFDDTSMFAADKIKGIETWGIQPKVVNTKTVDTYLASIEKPASGSIYDKLAARYRSQGEGAVLRTQKNLTHLFAPTITLMQERENAAKARFTLLKNSMAEFDDSKIFGDQTGNPMPIIDEIKGISSSVKEDLLALSRLSPNDDRYDEIRKRVEKNQDTIASFDQINKKLLEIRNAGTDESQWSKGMDATTADMWRDIYASDGRNIKVQDGKLVWTDIRANVGEGPKVISDMMSSNELGRTTNVIQGLSEHYEGDGSGRYENLSKIHLTGLQEIEIPQSDLIKIIKESGITDQNFLNMTAGRYTAVKRDDNGDWHGWDVSIDTPGWVKLPAHGLPTDKQLVEILDKHKPITTEEEQYKFTPGTGWHGGGEWLAKPHKEGERKGLWDKDTVITKEEWEMLPAEERKEYRYWRTSATGKGDKADQESINRSKQAFLMNLGYLDKFNADGSSAIDGVWGPNSKDAEKRYLIDRQKLVEESKNEYIKTDDAEKTTTGETKVISLAMIGDGPTMINNEATNLDRVIQGEVQKFIELGGTINDPMYVDMIKSKLFSLNALSPDAMKSLMFDGLNTDDDDLFTGSNTNSFIEGVIRRHYGENLGADEIQEYVNLMRSGDVTQQYTNEEGRLETLQSQFMKWYKEMVDDKIIEGKKSRVLANTLAQGGGGTGRGTGRGTGVGRTGTGNFQKTGVNMTFGTRGAVESSYGNKTRSGLDLAAGEISITGADIHQIVSLNSKLKDYLIDEDGVQYPADWDLKINNDNVIMRYENGEWIESQFNVDSMNRGDVLMYNAIMNAVSMELGKQGQEFKFTPGQGNFTVSTRMDHAEKTGYLDVYDISKRHFAQSETGNDFLLDHGGGDDIVAVLNKKFGRFGFRFIVNDGEGDPKLTDALTKGYKYERTGEGLIRVYYRDPQNGPVWDSARQKNLYASFSDHEGYSGAYIDVLHDSWSNERRWKNERYLEKFILHCINQNMDYWNEEVKYDIQGVEMDSNYADEITYTGDEVKEGEAREE